MPRRFVFKLQPVLEQRRRVEREHQRRVAQLETKRIGIEQTIRECQRSSASARDDLRSQLTGGDGAHGRGVSPEAVRMQANASLHLITRAQRAVLELAGVHKHIETARSELLRATTARRAVELLRDRQYEAWKRLAKRREAAEIDEIVVMRHGRSDGGRPGAEA